jgi:hypothetical protein
MTTTRTYTLNSIEDQAALAQVAFTYRNAGGNRMNCKTEWKTLITLVTDAAAAGISPIAIKRAAARGELRSFSVDTLYVIAKDAHNPR